MSDPPHPDETSPSPQASADPVGTRSRRSLAQTMGTLAILAFMLTVTGLGIQGISNTAHFYTLKATASGTITEIDRTGRRCQSIVNFNTENGGRYTTSWDGCSSKVGDTVTVRYDPAQPSQATANGALRMYVAYLLLALALLAIGVPGSIVYGLELVRGKPTTS